MGLSNENLNPNTATIDDYAFNLVRMKAAQLGSALIRGERNDDYREREASNTAHGVHVRKLVQIRPHVDTECADHNSRVASVGAVEAMEHLWKGRR